MKVLHVIPSVSPADGGPSFAVSLMARGLSESGIQVDVATTIDKREQDRLGVSPNQEAARNGVRYFYFRRQSQFYKVSLPMKRWLSRHAGDYDLIHIHALFSYTSNVAARIALQKGVPYIIRPLGVLNRWGMMNRRRLLKRASFRFIERNTLRSASAIHYTSRQEKSEAEALDVTTDSFVIPLGINLSEFESLPAPDMFYDRFPGAKRRDIILFLSRLDGKKGLDLLLGAFASIHDRNPNSLLVIAGSGDAQFEKSLRELAARLNVSEHVIWTGFLSGDEKLAAFRSASVFALPSYSENFGIALVEALAAGLPAITSDQVGIASDIEQFDAGLVIPCREQPLASALERLLADNSLRSRLSANARRLARERFSVEAMTGSLVEMYRRVLTGQERQEEFLAERA